MAPRLQRFALGALMPGGAFAVHQLRYLLAFHGDAGVELQRQEHAYLHSLVPWIALLIALATGIFVRALGRAFEGHRSVGRYAISLSVLWLVCALLLVSIYVCQEFLEGLFATGHPAGLIGIFGYGGWWSIPAALAVGLVLAAAFHGALWVLREIADRRAPLSCTRYSTTGRVARAAGWVSPPLVPLADGWSGRGPPV